MKNKVCLLLLLGSKSPQNSVVKITFHHAFGFCECWIQTEHRKDGLSVPHFLGPLLAVSWDLSSTVHWKTNTWPLSVGYFGLSHNMAAGLKREHPQRARDRSLALLGSSLESHRHQILPRFKGKGHKPKSLGIREGCQGHNVITCRVEFHWTQLWKLCLPFPLNLLFPSLQLFPFCSVLTPLPLAFLNVASYQEGAQCSQTQQFTGAELPCSFWALPWALVLMASGLGSFRPCYRVSLQCSPVGPLGCVGPLLFSGPSETSCLLSVSSCTGGMGPLVTCPHQLEIWSL